EIQTPPTPIPLPADRMAPQTSRTPLAPNVRAIIHECTNTIQQEVNTLKSLVDEFSQFSRFPRAQLLSVDLNEIVESALSVFAGRLENITVSVDLARGIPNVVADREQMKRVIVNLIDNAAEAMIDSPVRCLFVRTLQSGPDTVELAV